ncbi:MAG: polyprenyl synthetase family protein [Vicinamibacterales bacterium]|nr:polyprenyl synthetase family protein [Vicinamibacterales bacterium]
MTTVAADGLREYLRERRQDVDAALRRALPAPGQCPALICDAMAYSVFAGGKRFRPVLTLAAADAVSGGDPRARERAMPAACAIEMIHTYSLIHDDLPAMDDDTLRRGKPTLHVVHGEGMAILAGDGLHAEAFALLAREPDHAGDPELAARKLAVIQCVSDAAGPMGMVGGQAIDLRAAGHGADTTILTADGLRDMHARKTGALIRASAVAGAVMAGASPGQTAAIDDYAAGLGLAFQIVDDVLDVEGAAAELGKSTGKDAAANKPTYPLFFGLDESRRLARSATDTALAALDRAGFGRTRLADIAEWLVSRTS